MVRMTTSDALVHLQDLFHRRAENYAVIFVNSALERNLFSDGATQSASSRLTMTYNEVDQLAEHVALFLAQKLPAARCHSFAPVGIYSTSYIAVPSLILGTLRASRMFSFLDVKDPLSMIKRCGITYVFVQSDMFSKFQENVDIRFKKMWEEQGIGVGFVLLRLDYKCTLPTFPKDAPKLAYAVQTSGTTGNPKLVYVPHQCIIPNIRHLRKEFAISSDDVVLLTAPLTFDPSIVEIFLALSSGATLLMVPEPVKAIPPQLVRLVIDNKVTVMQATPSLLQNIGTERLKHGILSKQSPLRVLALGGERCPSTGVLHSWKDSGNSTKLYNVYGTTEVSAWASCGLITDDMLNGPDEEVPLGDPLEGTLLEVQDEQGLQCSEGELFIGGEERWCIIVPDDNDGELSHPVMRASGDLVCKEVTKDERTRLLFVGRKDRIVKFNGKKVSLSHLEQVISASLEHAINAIACIYDTELRVVLVCLVVKVSHQDKGPEIKQAALEVLRKQVQNLPPVNVYTLPRIPMTVHGKTDEKQIIRYAHSMPTLKARPICPFRVQDKLSAMWKDYLHTEVVREHGNFILCGGDSVSAIQFALELESYMGQQLPLLVDVMLGGTYCDILTYLQQDTDFNSTKNKGPSYKRKGDDIPGNLKSKVCLTIVTVSGCFVKRSRRGKLHVCKCGCCTETVEPLKNKKELGCVWKFDLSKCIDASPLVISYKSGILVAFIGSHSGRFVALCLQSGSPFWEVVLPDRIESSADLSWCGSYIVVGCYDHQIYCFAVKHGVLHWSYETGAEVKSSPVCTKEGLVICGSHDKHVYALNIEGGECVWKVQVSNGSIFSSPCLPSDGLLYAASLDGVMVALCQRTGERKWEHACQKPIFSSPVAVAGGVCVGSVSGDVFFWEHSGQLKWTFHCDGPVFSSPCFYLGGDTQQPCIIIGSHACIVYCLSALDGSVLWKHQGNAPYYATPQPEFRDGESRIVIVSTDGTLDILNASSGISLWQHKFPGEVFSSPVSCDDLLIVGCRDNFVYCFSVIPS